MYRQTDGGADIFTKLNLEVGSGEGRQVHMGIHFPHAGIEIDRPRLVAFRDQAFIEGFDITPSKQGKRWIFEGFFI